MDIACHSVRVMKNAINVGNLPMILHKQANNDHSSKGKNCREFSRQKDIRQLMAFSNISYYEANQQVPRSQNASMYLNNAYFPELNRNGDTNHNQLAIHERRTAVINNSNDIPTYSQTLRTPNKRRRDSNTGYDKEAHNQCLITPRDKSNFFQICLRMPQPQGWQRRTLTFTLTFIKLWPSLPLNTKN
ncbi:hypothetical protein JTB14_035292 [Gonioctena quinquepunctata]|nr:hypothetical protein JTB14_035292 [Gonioctena quinquepunctata]